MFQLLLESFEGIRTIRSHSGEPYVQRHFETRLNEITTKSMRVVRYLGALIGGTRLLISGLMVTGCLTAVAWATSKGRMTVQDILVYPFFIGMFYEAAQGLAGKAYDWNRFLVQGGRLAELLYGETGREGLSLVAREGIDPRRVARLSVSNLLIGPGRGNPFLPL